MTSNDGRRPERPVKDSSTCPERDAVSPYYPFGEYGDILIFIDQGPRGVLDGLTGTSPLRRISSSNVRCLAACARASAAIAWNRGSERMSA